MGQANFILLFAGMMATLIGVNSLIAPNIARIIRAPGDARVKSIIAIIAGLILVAVSLLIEIPG